MDRAVGKETSENINYVTEERRNFKWWSLQSVKYCRKAREPEAGKRSLYSSVGKSSWILCCCMLVETRLQIKEKSWRWRTGWTDILPLTIVVLYPRERKYSSYQLTSLHLWSLILWFSTHFVFVALNLLACVWALDSLGHCLELTKWFIHGDSKVRERN